MLGQQHGRGSENLQGAALDLAEFFHKFESLPNLLGLVLAFKLD